MAKRGKVVGEGAAPGADDRIAALADYLAQQLANSRTSEAVDAAQDIMFDAWETEESSKRVALARRALTISGDCADAYVLLAQESAEMPEEAVNLLRQGVAAGERALGPTAFQEDVGMFWGLLETRPYMRARFGLAVALWEVGAAAEALEHAEDLLKLNPDDNQGVRFCLLNWLQELGRDAEAEQLLRQYRDDFRTEWAWGTALAEFRRHGDHTSSRKALVKAAELNRHVGDFLLKRKRLPKHLPPYVEVGGKDEAADYVEAARVAWVKTAGALEWVAVALPQTVAPAAPKPRSPRKPPRQ